MKLPTLAWLLAGWVVALIVPGVIVASVFDLDTNSTNVGGPFLIWIIGYLVQLGLFMAASRLTGKNNIIGWFVASLLPWACDWGSLAGLWVALPCALVAILVAVFMYRSSASTHHIVQDGIPATGTVLEVVKPLMNVVINNVYIKRRLRLRIERSDGTPPYEAVLHGTFMLGEIPDVGSQLALRVDPNKPQRFEVLDADSDVAREAPPSSSFRMHDVASPVPDDGQSLTDQLERLNQLHASGGLSDQEFEQAKARVLGG